MTTAKPSNWTTKTIDGIEQLTCEFTFKNYLEALAFTNKVAEMAETQDHHPTIVLEWGKVTVNWWTHTAQGLTEKDHNCAQKTDDILAS